MQRCFCCGGEHPPQPSPEFEWPAPIPKILHHVWLTDAVPSELLNACRQSYLDAHPGWTAIYHRGAAVFDHPTLGKIRGKLYGAYALFGGLRGGALAHTPWGAQADLLRLAALYVYGGFYVDHDLFCLRPLDDFRRDDLVLVNCQDEPLHVTEALIGCHPMDPRMMSILETFMGCDIRSDSVCPRLTCWAHSYNWKTYPAEYFCPHPRASKDLYRVTDNTHAIHCWKQNTYDLDRLRALVP